MNSNLLALFGSWCTSDLGSSAAAVNSHKSISTVNSKEISQLTCADGRWIDPVRCFVPFALCPWGSMKFVAFVTVERDSASNSIVCHMRTIASIVRTTWWITHWVIGKSYLSSSNCSNYQNYPKRVCHQVRVTPSKEIDDVKCFQSEAYI